MSETLPPEVEPVPPSIRVVVAVLGLFLFRWSVYSPVSTATTAEVAARDRLRTLVDDTQAALRANHFEAALPILEELTHLQPKNQVFWWQRAIVTRSLGRRNDEALALEQFVKLSPLPGEACPRLPLIYGELGQKREAMDAFERCAAFDPNDSEMAFYLGHAYELDGQVDQALRVYTEALKHNINADVEAGVGRMLLRKGKPAEAYAAVQAVLRRNANNTDALLVAGLALIRQGQYDAAKEHLERGVAHHDGSDLRYALGLIAELQGRPADALAHYDSALKLDPDNQDAKNRRARLVAAGK